MALRNRVGRGLKNSNPEFAYDALPGTCQEELKAGSQGPLRGRVHSSGAHTDGAQDPNIRQQTDGRASVVCADG